MGKPKFSEDVREELLARLAKGESMATIDKDPRMPSWTTVTNWLNSDPDFVVKYARAREAQADYFVEQMIAIADEASADTVQAARLQIETRKWIAAKTRPKKYGDKLAIGGADDLPPVQTLDASKLPTDVLRQIMQARTDATDPG